MAVTPPSEIAGVVAAVEVEVVRVAIIGHGSIRSFEIVVGDLELAKDPQSAISRHLAANSPCRQLRDSQRIAGLYILVPNLVRVLVVNEERRINRGFQQLGEVHDVIVVGVARDVDPQVLRAEKRCQLLATSRVHRQLSMRKI